MGKRKPADTCMMYLIYNVSPENRDIFFVEKQDVSYIVKRNGTPLGKPRRFPKKLREDMASYGFEFEEVRQVKLACRKEINGHSVKITKQIKKGELEPKQVMVEVRGTLGTTVDNVGKVKDYLPRKDYVDIGHKQKMICSTTVV